MESLLNFLNNMTGWGLFVLVVLSICIGAVMPKFSYKSIKRTPNNTDAKQ